MKYIVKSNDSFLCLGLNGSYVLSTNRGRAREFTTLKKAKSVIQNLPKCYKGREFDIVSCKNQEAESENIDIVKLHNALEECQKAMETLSNQRETMLSKLSDTDQKISDILHYIEKYDFSASEGYLLAKQLKDLRQERRQIKNQIYAADAIDRQGFSVDKNLISNFSNINNTNYTPRYFSEMFAKKECKKHN